MHFLKNRISSFESNGPTRYDRRECYGATTSPFLPWAAANMRMSRLGINASMQHISYAGNKAVSAHVAQGTKDDKHNVFKLILIASQTVQYRNASEVLRLQHIL